MFIIMNFLDIAKRRYTTKRYTNNEKIEEDKINTLKHILRLSPSSINSQPWRFIFVSDEERSEEHTSELQSRENLVCRLLLEKKKNKHMTRVYIVTKVR